MASTYVLVHGLNLWSVAQSDTLAQRFQPMTLYAVTMYVSRAVRTLREDPVPGAEVTLLLTVREDLSGVRAAVHDAGGRVERQRPLDTLEVTVPQANLGAFLDTADVSVVETADTAGVAAGDAGEDVEYEEGSDTELDADVSEQRRGS